MLTRSKRSCDEQRDFDEPLQAILRAAEDVGELSVPELRKRIDEVHAFVGERFLPNARAFLPPEYAEIRRLAEKLLALRERLLYSYFGPAQLRSLREVLYDLHALIRVHLAIEVELAWHSLPIAGERSDR
jgi:hypothetical protein